MNCPICHSLSIRSIGERYDDRYGFPGYFSLLTCIECEHQFLNASFTANQLKSLYSQYYPRTSFKSEDHRPHQEEKGLKAWLDGLNSSAFRWIPPNVRILDIGCGFGEALGYHKARGCEVYGVEADANIIRVAEKFGYNVEVGLFDADRYIPNSFDYVTLDQVFEHVQNQAEVLRGIAKILKPGGWVILSLPNAEGWGAKLFGRKWINWHAPYHLHFFSIKSMQLTAEKAGLVLEETKTLTASAWLHFQWIHLLTCPLEGIPSSFWASNGRNGFAKKIIIKIFSILHYFKINCLITRLFDALGMGDNRLYFLRKP